MDAADRVADEIAQWLETRSQQVADAILESVYRPRVVEPTTQAATAYYRSILLTPDGFVNEQGKQMLIETVGAQGYREIARSVARSLRAEQEQAAEEATG